MTNRNTSGTRSKGQLTYYFQWLEPRVTLPQHGKCVSNRLWGKKVGRREPPRRPWLTLGSARPWSTTSVRAHALYTTPSEPFVLTYEHSGHHPHAHHLPSRAAARRDQVRPEEWGPVTGPLRRKSSLDSGCIASCVRRTHQPLLSHAVGDRQPSRRPFLGDLLGPRRRRGRDLAQHLPEGVFVAIGAMLARRLNELLSLALAFVGWLGLRHGASRRDGSVGDLRPRWEVCCG